MKMEDLTSLVPNQPIVASPEVFQAALKSFAAEGGAQATLTMITPHLRLDAK